MTYRVYEDREGKLHMTIYDEDTIGTCILAVCYDIKPEKLRKHINKLEDLENWQKWDSVVFADTKNEYVVRLRNDLYRYCNVIDYTELIAGVGLIRTINFDSMGVNGKEAYNG